MKILKLDFNERADSIPGWLKNFEVDTSELWKYPNKNEIENKIANQFDMNAKQVFISNGGDESIELLFKLCKLKGQSILLPKPAFSQYTHNIKVWGIDYQTLESQNNLSFDTQAIKNSIKANQWLILTRPNNPTGECIDELELIQILDRAKQVGCNVFLDEAYIEFFQDFENRLYAKEYDNVISLRTFSKAYGLAGARIGYLLGNSKLIEQFKLIAMPFNVNRLSLQLVNQALENQSEVKQYCQKINSNRVMIYQFLKQCNIEVFDGKGNFLLFKLNQKLKELVSNYLSKNDIVIKTQMQGLKDCVRITIPENIDKLMLALKTLFAPEILGFDMDGVLIDTSESYDVCIQKTVKQFILKAPTLTEITTLREMGGFNNDWDLSLELIKNAGIEVTYEDVKNAFQLFYLGTETSQGMIEKEKMLLNMMTWNQFNTRKAIITGRPKSEAIDGVNKLNINPDAVISADDVSEQKPSPQGIFKVQQKLKQSIMWYFGDTVDDMQAGRKANCICIGIGANCKNLYQAGADLVLDNINQAYQLITNYREES
jgi:histidinol-phosphate aminotransferase